MATKSKKHKPLPPISARNFYAYANCYEQALRLCTREPARMNEVILPFHLLLGFIVELHLKSWLRQEGKTTEELRYAYGHNLTKLRNDCAAAGFESFSKFDELIDLLDAPHGKDFTFRYLPDDGSITPINPSWALGLVDWLEKRVREHIGLPPLAN